MDSNKLVEKFGIPQFVQHHDVSDPAKQLYIELFMFSQFMWKFKGNVYRKDRKSDHHGGVFVAIKNTFDSEEAEELKSTAEIIWAKLTLPSGSKLYIGSGFVG
jgi:hypothetical protein